MSPSAEILVLGLGNRLMSDDAAGSLVIERLQDIGIDGVRLCDGGTMGLELLPLIETCNALVVVDAVRFGAPAGTVEVFKGADMDHQLGGKKRSAHEVALADLMSAAALMGAMPQSRALVGVEPELVALGLNPTPPVAEALPAMVDAVLSTVAQWRKEARAA